MGVCVCDAVCTHFRTFTKFGKSLTDFRRIHFHCTECHAFVLTQQNDYNYLQSAYISVIGQSECGAYTPFSVAIVSTTVFNILALFSIFILEFYLVFDRSHSLLFAVYASICAYAWRFVRQFTITSEWEWECTSYRISDHILINVDIYNSHI